MGGELVGLPTFKSIESHRQWIREHMAAAFRVLARQGLIEGVAGHMSVRDPQEEHQFWMNPYVLNRLLRACLSFSPI